VSAEAEKRKLRRKIHIVGDSQVFGWGLSDEETVCAQLQGLLGDDYVVFNHGVPGFGPFQYLDAVDSIAKDEIVVVLFSVENDLTDAYSAKTNMTSRNGYLLREHSFAKSLPSWAIASHTFATVSGLWMSFRDKRLTPLAYNSHAKAAATTLAYRVDRLARKMSEERGSNIIYGVIPWDAAIIPERVSAYYPFVSEPKATVYLPDELALQDRFRAHNNKQDLYLKSDSHISPVGAKIVATVLAACLNNE
jgi:hypothetical protein